jgi:phosphoribosyl 1,2-cyclic phosphate phosphodiesterase
MLRVGQKKLTAVLITHPHKDHVGGIDDTRPFQYFQQGPTHIYGNTMSLEGIKKEIPYAFEPNPYPGVPLVLLHTIDQTPFYIGDLYFLPILVWHHKMPVFGFRIGPFTYITDANFIEESELNKIKGSHTLVLNALRKQKHISHYTLDEAVGIAQQLEVQQGYFTHISHQLGRHQDILPELPNHMALAYDGLVLQF